MGSGRGPTGCRPSGDLLSISWFSCYRCLRGMIMMSAWQVAVKRVYVESWKLFKLSTLDILASTLLTPQLPSTYCNCHEIATSPHSTLQNSPKVGLRCDRVICDLLWPFSSRMGSPYGCLLARSPGHRWMTVYPLSRIPIQCKISLLNHCHPLKRMPQ